MKAIRFVGLAVAGVVWTAIRPSLFTGIYDSLKAREEEEERKAEQWPFGPNWLT